MQNKKRHPTSNLEAVAKHLEEPKAVVKHSKEPKAAVKHLGEPKAVVKQLADNDGLERADDSANDISIINNASSIAVAKIGRASCWYDNTTQVPTLRNAVLVINQYKSFMRGMNDVPFIGDLAMKTDAAVPYFSMPLKTVWLLARHSAQNHWV